MSNDEYRLEERLDQELRKVGLRYNYDGISRSYITTKGFFGLFSKDVGEIFGVRELKEIKIKIDVDYASHLEPIVNNLVREFKVPILLQAREFFDY